VINAWCVDLIPIRVYSQVNGLRDWRNLKRISGGISEYKRCPSPVESLDYVVDYVVDWVLEEQQYWGWKAIGGLGVMLLGYAG